MSADDPRAALRERLAEDPDALAREASKWARQRWALFGALPETKRRRERVARVLAELNDSTGEVVDA